MEVDAGVEDLAAGKDGVIHREIVVVHHHHVTVVEVLDVREADLDHLKDVAVVRALALDHHAESSF